jgi:hypothetical protein
MDFCASSASSEWTYLFQPTSGFSHPARINNIRNNGLKFLNNMDSPLKIFFIMI